MTARVLVVLALLVGASGCGRPFDAKAAPGFVEVKDDPTYDFRAVAPDGVVVAVRAVKLDSDTDLSYWSRAFVLKMRELEGYALLASRDVRSRDGRSGKELVFGHDESGRPYLYRVRLFLDGRRLYIVEAGGAKADMDRYAPSVEWMLGALRLS